MRNLSRVLSRWAVAFAVLLVVAAFDVLGLFGPIDRALMDVRFQYTQRQASGDVVIVQIDPRSIRELDVWPWPRGYHAQLIDRLVGAGAREIAVDIDFSARGSAAGDTDLAAALARAQGRVILPAFRQAIAPEANDLRLFDTLPRPEFRAHVQLGGVNVSPAPDGLIREVQDVHRVDGENLPALFALLAGPSVIKGRSFYIDYGIDPHSIPRVSYVDVLRGEVAPEVLAGKAVIVGTTAAELGDALPAPVYRSMSGPALQAMAFESLRQGRDIQVLGSALSVPVSAVLIVLFTAGFARLSWRWALASGVLAVFVLEGLAFGVQQATPLALTTAPWAAAAGASLLVMVCGRIESQARQILAQREAIDTRGALMDRMVENSFDGIIVADEAGAIQVMNEAAVEILRHPAGEAMGRPVEEILPGVQDIMATVTPVLRQDDSPAHWAPCETLTQRADGQEIAIELTIGIADLAPLRLRGQYGAASKTYRTFTFRDISDRKSAQEAEHRAADAALAANRAKTEFLANMSHELRTPLNAIIGFSEMIRNKVLGPIEPEAYSEYVDDIHLSGTHLLGIINDILDVSRIELGRYEIMEDEFDLRKSLESCASIAHGWPTFVKRRFEADLSPALPRIWADQRVLKQTIINLLANAFKYSEDGDQIRLAADQDETGDIVITVSDSGVGIAAENLPSLTEPFFQVDGGFTRESEGVGLGLYLCNGFVRLHGGELSIDSELGQGTVVTVRLPGQRAIAQASGVSASA